MNKYQKYTIQITYLNGNKENIEYTNFKNINTSSYKEMLKIYTETKEQYKNESVTIDFVGVTPDEKMNVLFSKKIKSEDEENMNSFELIKDIYSKTLLLQEKAKAISDKRGLIDKEKNIFEHKDIEFIDLNLLTDEYKIKAFDEYRRILLERRIIKNEESNIKSNIEYIDIILNNITKIHNNTIKHLVNNEKSTISAINNEVPELKNKQIIKQYKYNNFKERINLMKQLEGKYDKVINDEVNKVLQCYNKSKV